MTRSKGVQQELAANINIDGNLALLWPVKDIIARGAEHSTLSEPVHKAAARRNLDVTPDPFPELVLFMRSDQYSFVKQRIPAIFLGAGVKSSDPETKPHEIITKWRQTTCHKPQDDINQPFDFESGATYAKYAFLLGFLVEQKTERPAWNPGDFFGQHYSRSHN